MSLFFSTIATITTSQSQGEAFDYISIPPESLQTINLSEKSINFFKDVFENASSDSW